MRECKTLLLKDFLSLKNSILLALRKPWRWLFTIAFFAFFIYRRIAMVKDDVLSYPDAGELSLLTSNYQDKLLLLFATFIGIITSIVFIVVLSRSVKRNTSFFILPDTHFLFSGPFNPRVLLMYHMGRSLIPAFISSLILLLYFFVFINPESNPFSAQQILKLAIPMSLFIFSIKPLRFLIFSYVSRGHAETAVKHVYLIRNLLVAAIIAAAGVNYQQSGIMNLLDAVFVNGTFQYIPIVGWFHACVMGIWTGDMIWWATVLFVLYVVALPTGVYWLGNQYYEDILASAELKTRAEQFRSGETQLSDEVEYSWAIHTKKIREHRNFGHGAAALFWKSWVMSYRQTGIPFLDPTSIFTGIFGIVLSVVIRLAGFDSDDFKVLLVFSFFILAFLSYSAGHMRVKIGDLTRPQFALIPDSIQRKLFYFLLLDLLQVSIYTFLFYFPVVLAYGEHYDIVPTAILASVVFYITGFLFQLNIRLRITNIIDRYIFLPLAYFSFLLFGLFPVIFLSIAAFGFFKSYAISLMTVAITGGIWSTLLYIFAVEEIDRLEY